MYICMYRQLRFSFDCNNCGADTKGVLGERFVVKFVPFTFEVTTRIISTVHFDPFSLMYAINDGLGAVTSLLSKFVFSIT